MSRGRIGVVLAVAAACLIAGAVPAAAVRGGQPGQAAAVVPSAAPAGFPVLGIDVSSHDHAYGPIGWPAVAASGVRFAYVKATEGLSYTNPYFASDNSAAKAAGLLVGAYVFARPDLGNPVGQADYFIDRAAWHDDPQTLVPFVDLEWPYAGLHLSTCYGLTPGAMTTWIHAFIDRIRTRIGRAPMIYTNTHWWNPCTGNNASAAGSPLDIAAYTTTPPVLPAGWQSFTLWQYAAGNPAAGTFDRDAFNGDLASLARLAGGPPPPVPANRSAWSPSPTGSKAVLSPDGTPQYFGRASDDTLARWQFANGGFTSTSLGGSLVGQPTAVRAANGTVYVFGRTAANTLQVWSATNGTWSTATIGGSLAGDPVISAVVDNVPYVLGRGTDGTLWQWYFHNGTWFSRTLGGALAGDPAVAGAPDAVPWVFARNPENTMQQWYYAAGAWQNRPLGGSLTGTPVATDVKATVPYLFGRGTDNTLSQWYFHNGTWFSRKLGAALAGDPTVAGAPDTVPWVFARNPENTMQQWYYAAGAWQNRPLGGSLAGTPIATDVKATVPYLFGRGTDNTLSQWYFHNGTWFNRALGGSVSEDPMVAGAPDQAPWVFGRNTANSLQRWYYANLSWQTGNVGGALS